MTILSTTLAALDSIEELSPPWLTGALGLGVRGFTVTPVGTGQMGSCFRISLEGDEALPATVLLKLPAGNGVTVSKCFASSEATS